MIKNGLQRDTNSISEFLLQSPMHITIFKVVL